MVVGRLEPALLGFRQTRIDIEGERRQLHGESSTGRPPPRRRRGALANHHPRSAPLLRDQRPESRRESEGLSERIGHADVGFFLQTYAHARNNDDREVAEQAASFPIGEG
jgi:hypothetical protein